MIFLWSVLILECILWNFWYHAQWWLFLRPERVLEIKLCSQHSSSAHNTPTNFKSGKYLESETTICLKLISTHKNVCFISTCDYERFTPFRSFCPNYPAYCAIPRIPGCNSIFMQLGFGWFFLPPVEAHCSYESQSLIKPTITKCFEGKKKWYWKEGLKGSPLSRISFI